MFKASNNDGVWNETPLTLSVVVTPPFWDTWYAYIFYFGATLGTGALGFVGVSRARLNRLDNQRKDKELAEAREFQLKMIAKEIPDYDGMNIKAYMRTSTEVGGDYYDYRIAADNRLTLVLGDATGHGMQAGTLVTATKSLFQSLIKKNQ